MMIIREETPHAPEQDNHDDQCCHNDDDDGDDGDDGDDDDDDERRSTERLPSLITSKTHVEAFDILAVQAIQLHSN